MEVECIPFSKTGYFPQLITDYLDEKEALLPFYSAFPRKETFQQALKARKDFPQERRETLQAVLEEQYEGISMSSATRSNLDLLKSETTFTVVTGHQLNLFTGPLYFLYKIITAIKTCSALKEAYPDSHFVPVYWMATEDHDFEEINHFSFRGKKLHWNRSSGGAVGTFSTKGLEEVLEAFALELGSGERPEALKKLFSSAYLEHKTLTEATRYLVNELFGSYGLVILDGDHADLKREFLPFMKQDILEQVGYQKVSEAIETLSGPDTAYSIQVNPRELNYFYLQEGQRERLEQQNGTYQVLNTDLSFSRDELVQEMDAHPERFSPNVITRPLYQEVILPNLCYIGGGGELSYWLELKPMFDALEVPFPLLMLRNSALMISGKQQKKLRKLHVQVSDLFLKPSRLINKKIREISNIDIDFTPQREHLKKQFEHLYTLADQTDPSFLGAVKAQEVKQLKGLDHLEKRLLKAQKRKLKDHVVRLSALQNELFPGQSLQERQLNFSDLYLELGEELIPLLMEHFQEFPSDFLILKY